MITLYSDFNPRSREGSDDNRSDFSVFPSISIHAPAKGATLTWIMFLYLKKYFNPRSREGSDRQGKKAQCTELFISIHAPAKGATNHNTIMLVHHHHFNPRSREGSDFAVLMPLSNCKISIHAPAKGATVPNFCLPRYG